MSSSNVSSTSSRVSMSSSSISSINSRGPMSSSSISSTSSRIPVLWSTHLGRLEQDRVASTQQPKAREPHVSLEDAAPQSHDQQYKPLDTQTEVPKRPRFIASTEGNIEELDPSFRMRNTDWETFFTCGRVFKTLWTDPAGPRIHANDTNQFTSQGKFKVAHGQYVLSKIRRFIVVSSNSSSSSCQCLPITIYGGKGYQKRAIDLAEHGQIYYVDEVDGTAPGISKLALRVKPSRNGEKLGPNSLVNYGRAYCVYKNVKVRDLGQLDSTSQKLLRRYYKEIHFPVDDDSDPAPPQGSEQYRGMQGVRSSLDSSYESEPRPSFQYQPFDSHYSDENPLPLGYNASGYEIPEQTDKRPGSPPGNRNLPPGSDMVEEQIYQVSEDWNSRDSHEGGSNSTQSRLSGKKERSVEESDLAPEIQELMARIERLEQGITTQRHSLSRTSSESSLNSISSGGFSVAESAPSSASSSTPNPLHLQRFVDLLFNDFELNDLLETAKHRISFDKFEINFKRCLRLFSEHLRAESAPSLPRYLPKLIRRLVTNAAYTVRRSLELSLQTEVQTKDEAQQRTVPLAKPHVEDINEADEDDIGDLDIEFEEQEQEHENENENENEGVQPNLEAMIVTTSSFMKLRENFRIFLSADHSRRAIFDCWPAALPESETTELVYFVLPGLEDYLKYRLPGDCQLGSFLVFIGTDEAAEAISCEEYLLREWPEVGRCVVDFINGLLLNTQQDAQEDTAKISMRLCAIENARSQAGILMMVQTSYCRHGQVADALSWLSAVLRVSPHQEVCTSRVSVQARNTDAYLKRKLQNCPNKIIQVTLNGLERLKHPSTCWHSLFPHIVMAQGFPVRPRMEGIGLEISFANALHASKCLSFVEYDNGLIAHGLKSVLIPMAELNEDDAIQWHFENKTKVRMRRISSIGQILRILAVEDWYKVADPGLLMKRRCFLGWVEEANVVLGTSLYTPHFRPSRAPLCPRLAHIQRFEITASVSAMSWATLQGTFIREPVAISSSVSTSQIADLLDLLNMAEDEHGIVFEHDARTGWWVSRASIVLQMAHSTIQTCHYDLYNGDNQVSKDDQQYFAQKFSDGASSAVAALKQCLHLKIRKPTGGSELFVVENFSETIARIWHTLSDIAESLESTSNELYLVGQSVPRWLLGVDLIDAINNKRPMAIRRVEVNQPWTHLTTERPLVLFCKDIPPPIVAVSNSCKSCSNVPPQQNLLVATASTVHSLLDYQDYGLAEGLNWCASKNLIDRHESTSNAPVQYIQKLQSKKKPSSNTKIRAAVQSCLRGAFIFGNGTEKKCNVLSTVHPIRTTQTRDSAGSDNFRRSVSQISSTASATSSELTNTSITSTQENSDPSDESEADVSSPGLENPSAVAQDLETRSERISNTEVEVEPKVASSNSPSDMSEKGGVMKTARLSSMFAKIRKDR
ncbi:uncharacterized protein LY89DRAFT_369328 [Mollisia scopiformis]|uniref:DUF6590 domain-containing protein n=1 Tax=Mollisia scopiformis TaxID=149040 RepID=A0A132B661_MOLSC|nr:uncharacterized protein LY89DRAFT_369328 [Mollisia scopiformis]KUJ07157.1 hypothetical protein LY89DRAFT_369328 [Mollisia scopiformis]